jgi:hypothetical protein
MKLEEFTILRRDELVEWFKARFGRHWRQIVTRQSGEHPRAFDRWRSTPPGSLYRQIDRLDRWARSIGFQSPTDDRVQERLLAYQAFKKAAEQQIGSEQDKRIDRSSADRDLDRRQIAMKIAEALRGMGEASPSAATC